MSFKKICVCLILIFCLIGAASAAEDVSTDVVDASADAVAVSDDVDLDEVVAEVDSNDESLSVQEVEQVDVVDDSNSVLVSEENDNDITGQALLSTSNSEILANGEIIYYANNSANGGDGSSWEEAFGGEWAIDDALVELADNGDREGIIYVADGKYSGIQAKVEHALKYDVTFIGQGVNTILEDISSPIYGNGANLTKYLKYINFTINGGDLGRNTIFINCIFDGLISISKDLLNYESRHVVEYGYAQTYFMNFENCTFKDVTTTDALVTLYKYGAVTFNNCTFENIVADSIVYHNDSSYFEEDGITFKECTFKNSKFNGVADSLANFDDAIAIEDCNYDDKVAVGTTEVNGHFYVNATKLKVVAVDSAVDISSSEKGVVVITLTDGTNPIAGATVKYTVNGGEEQTVTTGDDGKATISGLTGEVTIAVNYEGNESFNAISDTKSFNFTEEPVVPPKVATKITAPKVSAVYNVAKKLVITLTDKDGKALANKKVTVKVGTISKTLNTNAKGQVSLNVATLVPKTYTASIKFAGDNDYTASSLNTRVVVSKAMPKLAANAKTFRVKAKVKKYTAILKNNRGQVMKKVYLTLRVGKKTYKAATNSRGIATFNVKLTKKGRYTAIVKFAGNKYYRPISKKVRITVKK